MPEEVRLLSFDTGSGILDAKRPGFRIDGDRTVYLFKWIVERFDRGHRRLHLVATSESGFTYTFNVGGAYSRHGVRIRNVRPRPVRRPNRKLFRKGERKNG